MKVAIIGSRNLKVSDLEKYIPEGAIEIVSGGAKGIDSCAKDYAVKNKIKITEFLPDYNKYGRVAPLKRNDLSRGGVSEPDFYGTIFTSAVLKYSQIRQDLLRFVPCRSKNRHRKNSAT